MIVRSAKLRPIPSFLLPFTEPTTSSTRHIRRKLHADAPKQARHGEPKETYWGSTQYSSTQIPPPTPWVPDTQTFLTLIGRGLSQYAPKIPSWKDLFTLDEYGLKEIGINEPRHRRYLQLWTHRYRQGRYGPGGTLQHVKDGVAELRIVHIPQTTTQTGDETVSGIGPGGHWKRMKKIVVNVPAGWRAMDIPAEELGQLVPVKGFQIKAGHTITGPFAQPTRGRAARITVTEGMWEERRGRKIDGGERRRAEVQAKRRGEERRAAAAAEAK